MHPHTKAYRTDPFLHISLATDEINSGSVRVGEDPVLLAIKTTDSRRKHGYFLMCFFYDAQPGLDGL